MHTQQKTSPRTGVGEDRGGIPIVALMTMIMLLVAFGTTVYLLFSPKADNSYPQRSVQTAPKTEQPVDTTPSTNQRVGELQMQRVEPRSGVPARQEEHVTRPAPSFQTSDPADKDPNE